jgi:hypothetical protein
MAQDIRKMIQEKRSEGQPVLPKGHETRFEVRLKESFPVERPQWGWMKIAAIAIAFIAVSLFGYYSLSERNFREPLADTQEEHPESNKGSQITMGDLSPDLKKVEDYYLTGINVQLASLQITKENKELIDGYMQRLSELDTEYTILNGELNEVGPTEATITALIDNLKMRLELLFKLKNKLKELKNQDNEDYTII